MKKVMLILLVIGVCTMVAIGNQGWRDEDITDLADPNCAFTIMPPVVEYLAIKVYVDSGLEWEIKTFDDLLSCTDRELANVATFISLARLIMPPEQLGLLADRLLPKRFKVTND